MAYHTEPRITLHPYSRRVRILDADTLIADARSAIELRDRGYPQRPELQEELPRPDVDMSRLSILITVANCLLNEDATYTSLPKIADVAWSDEQSVVERQAIAGRLAFDTS